MFYREYSDVVTNYEDLFACYRPLLEGLALYIQFDFECSRTYEASSEQFSFLLELVCTEFHNGSQPVTVEDVYRLLNNIRNAGYASGLLRLLMESTSADTAPYFLGYLMIKEMQRLLIDKDPRLADAEVYVIFVQGYLFYDRRLIDLCYVAPRGAYQPNTLDFLRRSISDLIAADPHRVRAAVDHANAPVNYRWLDFAAAICDGEMVMWQDSDLYRQNVKQFGRYVEDIVKRPFA